jgi:hypothetical protein
VKFRRINSLRRSYYTLEKLKTTAEGVKDSKGFLDTDKANLIHMLIADDRVLELLRKLMFEGYKIVKEPTQREIDIENKIVTALCQK